MPIFERFVVFLAVGFGTGYAKRAPGTVGSLIGLPLGYALTVPDWTFNSRIAAALLLCVVGFLITSRAERSLGIHDDPRIVMDEIVGQALTLMFLPFSVFNLLAGFALFRLFDIWKPGPIGYIDAYGPGAWGTFFDDVLAGIAAAGILYGLNLCLPG